MLDVDGGGGYSLWAYPEGGEDPSRDLLAVGVVRTEGRVAIHPEGLTAAPECVEKALQHHLALACSAA